MKYGFCTLHTSYMSVSMRQELSSAGKDGLNVPSVSPNVDKRLLLRLIRQHIFMIATSVITLKILPHRIRMIDCKTSCNIQSLTAALVYT